MCFGSRSGAAPAPGKEPWGRACFILPERARVGATLGPGAGWLPAPKQGRRARGAVQPEAEVWPGFRARARALFCAFVLCARTAFRPGAPAVPPRPRLKTPPTVVTHWLLGGGGPRREGPVAAVIAAQVWRVPRFGTGRHFSLVLFISFTAAI